MNPIKNSHAYNPEETQNRVYHANTQIYHYHGYNPNRSMYPPFQTPHGHPNMPPPFVEPNQHYANQSNVPPFSLNCTGQPQNVPHLPPNLNVLPHNIPGLPPNFTGYPPTYLAVSPYSSRTQPPQSIQGTPFHQTLQNLSHNNDYNSELNPNALSYYPSNPIRNIPQVPSQTAEVKGNSNRKTKMRNLRKKNLN